MLATEWEGTLVTESVTKSVVAMARQSVKEVPTQLKRWGEELVV